MTITITAATVAIADTIVAIVDRSSDRAALIAVSIFMRSISVYFSVSIVFLLIYSELGCRPGDIIEHVPDK